jgi:ubiquitin thioesterase protein OTUB1
VEKSLDFCVSNGASRFVLEDFHEPLVDTLKWIAEAKTPLTPEQLVERLVDPEVADYIVYYCRALVSAHFYGNWAQFEHILLPSVDLYIKANVEPMGRDADHPQILALASQFGVPVKVYYLDQTPGKLGGYVFPDLGEESPPRVTLLYRPGHYDLMYPK